MAIPWPFEITVKTPDGERTFKAYPQALTDDERKGAAFEAYSEAVQHLEQEQMKYGTPPPEDEDYDVRSGGKR